MEKLYSSKNMFENVWWGEEGVHPPWMPMPARTDNNVSYHYTNQPIWLQYDGGQILSKLFWNNSTYCTCIVWTLHFKNKGLVSKGGGSAPQTPPGCATDMRPAILRVTLFSKPFWKICLGEKLKVELFQLDLKERRRKVIRNLILWNTLDYRCPIPVVFYVFWWSGTKMKHSIN